MDILLDIRDVVTVQTALDFIQTPECGGEVMFAGTVRNHTKRRPVVKLFYECYREMAISEMHKIAQQVQQQWDIKKLVILHAVGEKFPGDVAVVVAVAATHRGIAFDACEYIIDTLKETVPIWKKEFFEDGEAVFSLTP
ncbi:MAG TPA: molybdenum cofactor biosynthesis protein MoaE [Chitinophaga sp.]|uniref:molybdopterin synthase catalytic subunit n=1 Tax=Chitinophaga sp. TaxID=1869181 RepID=UPI002C3CAB56|nr:molybdenum cofactor biosynthesis protein MoaE [Chitinophaga sp.]HVI46935.1 molybdenum cofactor biosynthesis protein MoaE [Chitinophaga sp.]